MKELKWSKHEGYWKERPLEVDTVTSESTVYFRKNIEEVPNKDDEGTHWQYDEAELTKEEYWQLTTDQKQLDLQSKIDYIAMMADIDIDE